MSFLTYVFGKGFTGGPDFNRVETFCFDLEDARLELTIPESNALLPPRTKVINRPFRSPGWFDENCKQLWNNFFVTIFGEPWVYSGPFWKVFNQPFGVLDIHVAIKRVLPEKKLDINNLDTLAEAIRWDYEWYFEVAEPGKYGRGKNRRIRQEAEDEYNSRHPKIPEERKLHQKEQHLKQSLRELPSDFETRQYSDQKWLYYSLEREPTYPVHYYCQPLDDQYYMYVRFHYRIDFRQYFHFWQADAEAAEQRMMEMIKLTYPNRLPSPDSDKSHQSEA